MGRFDNKVGIITGGAVGIGQAVAIALAREGASIGFTYLSHDPRETSSEVVAAGGRSVAKNVDVSDSGAVDRAIEEFVNELGEISILVNNAGGLIARVPILEMSDSHWEKVIQVNLTSAFYLSRAVARQMGAGGRIINVSSLAAYNGGGGGSGVYAAAKAGMVGFTRALAKELAPKGITVNAVAPGLILDTPFHKTFTSPAAQEEMIHAIPLGRPGQPTDVAEAVAWLAAPTTDWITGEVISVNGGQYFS